MFKPELDATASAKSPYCVRNTFLPVGESSVRRPHYSLRIAIENHGNTEAKKVEVFVDNLERQKGNGRFERVIGFIGTYLTWSGLEVRMLDVLNPKMPKYCCLCRVFWKENLPQSFYSGVDEPAESHLGSRTLLDLPPPPGSGHTQLFGPGNYRLTVRIGAANAQPIEKIVRIDVTGRWPGEEFAIERVNEVLDFGMEHA